MKIKVLNGGFLKHEQLFKKTVEERIPVDFNYGGMSVEFCLDKTIAKEESFVISGRDNEWKIAGSDELGLYFGIGKFLHTAQWTDEEFAPISTDGVVSPDCSFRAMYFSTHFGNYYHLAPNCDLKDYVDDMLLWGYNTIACIIPVATLKENDENFFKEAERARAILSAAKQRGMKTSIIICPNQGWMDAPEEYSSDISHDLTFRGDLGRNICMSKPEGVEYMRGVWTSMLTQFDKIGIDYIVTWPYDEGGCGCENCRPWGANKYCYSCIELKKECDKYYPNARFVVSTWAFDVPVDEGEFEGLYKRLTGDMAWADYIMVDAHRDYPRYPLEHDIIKPIVNFPEISMWGLGPWGGWGANPLPERFQRIWNDSKRILDGGMPYSEGIYEDISKIQFIGYYWEKDRHWTDIMAEYINYEFSSDESVIEDAIELMKHIEINHVRCAVPDILQPDMQVADKEKLLAERIDSKLYDKRKNAWRWRILYIRAILDYKRFNAYMNCPESVEKTILDLAHGADLLVPDEEAQDLFRELWKYYYSIPFNGTNKSTLPPLGGSVKGAQTIPDRRHEKLKKMKEQKEAIGNLG